MPTSDASWSGKLRLVGELERQDHWYLTAEDECAFFGEYTARGGYRHSSTNDIISNLKKKPETRNTSQWQYKLAAIKRCSETIRANIAEEALPVITIVPIPPSKSPSSPDYDDRMMQVAKATGAVDVRDLLFSRVEREPRHLNDTRRDPDELRDSIGVKPEARNPPPSQVILLDDVLTTGCSFKVCKAIVRLVWPGVPIFGLFIARRAIDRAVDFAAVELDF